VADEDHPLEPEIPEDREDVVGVPLERAVPGRAVGREVRPAGADVVEEDGAVPVLERRSDEPPHVLVAAEAVGEHHWLAVFPAGELDVILGEASGESAIHEPG
jgi:hypothetical protein